MTPAVVGSVTQGWVALSLVWCYRIVIRGVLPIHGPKYFPPYLKPEEHRSKEEARNKGVLRYERGREIKKH
jgi:hypothetical protein